MTLPPDLRDLVVGGDVLVPVTGGERRPFVNLDDAASTPIARPVRDTVDAFYTSPTARRPAAPT